MNEIDSKFKHLRVNLRRFGVEIAEDVFYRFHPITIKAKDEICVFCLSTTKITKEHVLPKWVFEKNTNITFISSTNKQIQTYNKAVVPTCAICNNSILAPIESEMIKIFKKSETLNLFSDEDLYNIIRWCEILDYKLQVYECRKVYLKYANTEYDPLWGILPLAHMRHFMELNPLKAFSFLRNSQRRITVKSKINRLNSIVLFNTAKPHFNFFNKPNEYIFVSFPMNNFALFYFLRKVHTDLDKVGEEAIYIIGKVMET
ncbi:hypothetical protein [Flavobacterium salmonis]|uniref:HNH endonuclease n=1 Tax=Flavobacterium salmonis TaxID=2654844 RepID=A0A6V6Z581_9FLAO|nr:hypothetical protein [Flavobacterium salmonis]CAD0006729.1 hypothetical protein FLAT13_03458 [Flavobacterium salmonis]